MPSASMQDAIVFAVNMPPHAPAPGMEQHSTISNCASSISPACSPPMASYLVGGSPVEKREWKRK
jgi:hypothetical protein